jgi:prepilin-type N-terminal cleavage/methylation domain-containing protein
MEKGFTLIEMLIATSLFVLIVVGFIGILTTVTQVQVQTSSSAVVNQESQFLLQKLQYYVETASIIDISTSTPTSTLRFDGVSSSTDPSYITLASGTVYVQQGGGALQPLTSNRVTVSNLSFTRRANPPGHDAVSISYTLSYNTSNIVQAFGQIFQTSIAQVSAATFDTGVYPSSPSTESLGNTSYPWSSINGVINFNGTNVGIGTLSAAQPLEVNGGVRLNPTGSVTQPQCNSAANNSLGTLWFSPGTGGGAGTLYLCNTNASGTYQWHQVTTN